MNRIGRADSDSEEQEARNTAYDASADTSNHDDETAERELDKDLQWATRQPDPKLKSLPLSRPVVIPQTEPGLANLFKRAWAPELAARDVLQGEWMQFLDHLNICKTGSPPLQVLNLAGTTVGFVPVHYAALAGLATNVVAVGGMVAVSRIRISKYLKRANEEYFAPRGLVASIAKQNNINQITGQAPDAPMLSEVALDSVASVIDRRMQAFGDSIALLHYDELPAQCTEVSKLDKLTAKMNAMKANRGTKKVGQGKETAKHQRKLEKSRAEAEEERQKIEAKAEKKIAKKPEDRVKIEKSIEKDLAKLDEDARSEEDDIMERSGKAGKKVERKVKRLMFVAVQDLEEYMRSTSH